MTPDTSIHLQMHLEPKEPIAVYELTASLTALWRQYQKFAIDELDLDKPNQAKLLVSSISPGSIDISFIPDLRDAIAAVAPIIDQVKVVSEFAGHIQNLLGKFTGRHKDELSEATATVGDASIKDCDDAVNIVKPIAEHGGTQTFNVYKGPVLIQNFSVSAPEARVISQEAAQQKAQLQFPHAERHQRVPLRWFRLDTNAAKQQGASPDKAIIDEIDPKPKPVFFMDELSYLKREIIESIPFKKLYFVDVEVSRIADKVVSYRVVGYHGSDNPDDLE